MGEQFWSIANSAVFGGTASTVTIGAGGVSIGDGSQFMRFDITGYILDAGANGLNFGTSATDDITLFANHTGAGNTATFTNTVGGGGNLILSAQNGGVANANTFLFNGTSTTGWSGTTTVNAGTTLSVAVSNQALINTDSITLKGGNILLTNTATGSENNINRIKDTAAITSYGSVSISIANTATINRAYSEEIGNVTLHNGQLNIGFTTIQNQASNTQTLTLGGLSRNGTASTIAVSGGGSGAGSISANSFIWTNGVISNTSEGEIVGPWMTSGTASNAQSDWAIYTSADGSKARITSANIAASAQSTWSTTHAASNNYTLNTNTVLNPERGRLTENRNINTLRTTQGDVAVTYNTTTEVITSTGHAFSDGDVVIFRNAVGGLTSGRAYYVIESATNTFRVSTTPGGSAIDLTGTQTGFVTSGVNLNGNTLGTNGILTGSTSVHGIGGVAGSKITLPTISAGNLYMQASASSLWIDVPITNNDPLSDGSGVLTLVKGGSSALILNGTNTYTGGTVINAGSVTFNTTAAAQSGSSRNITFGGSGTLTTPDTSSFATLTINQGAVAAISGNNITFATTTGSGTVVTGSGQSKTLNLGDASTFAGNIALGYAFNNLSLGTSSIQFNKLNDAAGSSIQIFRNGGGTDSGQVGQIALTSDLAPLTFNNRQIQLLPRTSSNPSLADHVLYNNNATAANKWVINTSLLNLNDRNLTAFTLAGGNAGDNAFNGTIGDSTVAAALSLVVQKTGTGKWILGGANTFTGGLVINQGTLSVATLNEANVAGPLGMNNTLQLGGTAIRAKAGNNQGSINAAGANSGTLEYTGGAVTSSRSFFIGDSTAANTGGGTILNNGTGAIVFSAVAFNPTQTGITGTRTMTLGGNNTGNNEIQGIIQDNVASTGKVNFAKSGVGTWILSGANSFTGTTTVSGGGTLILDFGAEDNSKLSNSASLALNGSSLVLRGGSHTEVVGSLSLGNFTGSTILRDQGTAKISLGAMTTGTMSTLMISDSNIAATTTANVNGILPLGRVVVGNHFAANDGTNNIVAYSGYNTATTAGGSSDTAIQELSGGGTMAATLRGYAIRLVNDGESNVLELGSRNLEVVNNSTLLYAGGGNNQYTINGTGSLTSASTDQPFVINTFTGTTLIVNAKIVGRNGNTTGIVKAGEGTLVVGSSNSTNISNGISYIQQGVLRLANDTGLGATTAGTVVQNGAALELANNISVGAEALTITGLGMANGGVLRNYAGINSWGGAITIGAGGARINSDVDSMTLTGGVVTSLFNNVTFGGEGNTSVSNTAISGAGNIIKDGAGKLTLSGSNTYTGSTTVSAGMLAITGTGSINSSSGIMVASGAHFKYNSSTALTTSLTLSAGATLSGSGAVNTALTLSSLDSVLAPGNSPGIQVFGVSQEWESFTYEWELNDWSNQVPGTGGNIDQIQITGGLTLSGTSYALNIFSLDALNAAGLVGANGGNLFTETSKSWTILTTTTGISGFNASTWTLDTAGFLDEEAGSWSLASTGNDLVLSYTVIPEPKAALLGGLGILLLFRRRR